MNSNSSSTSSSDRPRSLFVVGAKKCGTTALYHLLRQHPEIALCQAKEPEFYSHPDNLDKGLEWYLDGFRDDLEQGRSTILDCSVAYSQYPYRLDSSLLIQRDFPDARIVYVVRDPVERWFSDYLHEMRHGVYVSPEDAFVTEPRLLAASRFGEQLQRYTDVFGLERVLVLSLSEISSNPDAIAQRVFAHAGLSAAAVTAPSSSQSNTGGIDHYIRYRTTSKLFAFPGGAQLRQALPKSLRRRAFSLVRSSALGREMARSWPEPVFSDKLRSRVREALAGDTETFRQLSGIDPTKPGE